MQHRQQGHTQAVAAAKAGLSERSGRRVEKTARSSRKPRHWRTRKDPLAEVWESELVPLLERERFKWPDRLEKDTVTLSGQELNWLLDGYDINLMQPHKVLNYQSVG